MIDACRISAPPGTTFVRGSDGAMYLAEVPQPQFEPVSVPVSMQPTPQQEDPTRQMFRELLARIRCALVHFVRDKVFAAAR